MKDSTRTDDVLMQHLPVRANDEDSDGCTNVEEWLHALAAEVEAWDR